MLTIGKYNVCILDLLTDGRSGRLSASKLWQHIGFAAMTYQYLLTPVTFEVMLAYGSIVAGSHVAILFLKRRFPDAVDKD